MVCASCGRANQPGARFCGGCGAPFAPRCPACGAAGEPGASFCQACGSALAGRAREDPAARKVVTIVFADLKGSTPLQERLDPESSQRFMDRYHDAMRAEVEAERGVVTQVLGDGVKAVFGVPRVAEDDALRAVRAGVAMQRAFRMLAEAEAHRVGEIGLRVAVNTGEVVASAEREIIGDPVTVAALLQDKARIGDVVIAEPTRRLVAELVTLAPLGAFAVKDRAERVLAYRVVSLERPAGASATAFVGRESELARIRAVFDDAVASRGARLVVILGSPGLGKSRLIGEVARRLAESATVLNARCDSAGGATFAPVAAALRAHLGIDDDVTGDALHVAIHAATTGDGPERARIASGIAALLAGTPASHQETFFVVRRFLARVAAERPAVLVLDDLQWAEPLLLDLVEHLIQWTANTPLFVLVGARPELREARSSLTVPGPLVAQVFTLAGLDAAAATRLAANAIGADELPAAVAGRVLTASEGNPLFVGELVRMLVQDGALKRDGERWTTGTELAALQMPPTIQALLAARIERLRPDERTVLERAAVIGRQFSRAALAELLPRDVPDLDRVLEALRRSELVESDSGWFLGEPALRFHHVLTRDAAYRRLLKNRRAELHERFADWVLRRVGDEAPHDETLGRHLEQAHQHLAELGPVDARGRALGERAARYLGAAGRRALERDDLPLAASLLGRSVARLDEDDPARAELALDWCEALLSAGEVAAAAGAIDELGRFAHASPRLRAWHTCFLGQRAALTDPESLRATVDAVSAAAEALAAEGDTAGEAKGHLVHAQALARLGRMGACEAALDRAQAAARRMHDRRRANTVLAAVPLAVLSGPSPVMRASGRCLDVVRVLRITQGSPSVEAVALRCQGVLEALRGRSEAARRMVASSRRMVEELGITHRLLEADVFAGRIELIEGDAAAAERCLRSAYEGLRAQGLGIDAAQAAALLARALLGLDRVAEAEALSHESEKLAGDDLPASIAWRCVRAEALARRGEHAGAVELAQAAVQLAAATDVLLDHADARLALAAALRAAGGGAEAAAEEARAIELWEAKGATRLAERARQMGGRVAEPPQTSQKPRLRRRVQRNFATDNMRRVDEAVAARDRAAIASLIAADVEVQYPIAGRHYGREELLEFFRIAESATAPAFSNEPIAALGASLGLARAWESGSETLSGELQMGAHEVDAVVLVEADSEARTRRLEVFAAHQRGNAVARLYERYAETLPDGPERARANAAARAIAALTGPFDLARYADSFAPGIEYRDRRGGGDRLVGRAAVLQWLQTLPAIADDVSNRFDDVLASSPDALVLRFTNSGIERTGKSRFERPILWLGTFSAEGIAGIEVFEGDRDAEALARFDELARDRPAATPRRHVRDNTVTAQLTRMNAAMARRDVDELRPLHAEGMRFVHHATGAVMDLQATLEWWRLFLDRDAALRFETLATLGDSLALLRLSWTGSASHDSGLAVGEYEGGELDLVEVDAEGRAERIEGFALDRLGEALARLYERYAEQLPEGPARERAAAIVRTAAAMFSPFDPDRRAPAMAPDIEHVDHRALRVGQLRGREAVVEWLRTSIDVGENLVTLFDDVLAFGPDALLLLRTNVGTGRASGGSYEQHFLWLGVFSPEGLISRIEIFEPERVNEALARFDELTAAPAEPWFANAATRSMVRMTEAWNARNWPAIEASYAPEARLFDRLRGGMPEVDRAGLLAFHRAMFEMESSFGSAEVLATRGERLALGRILLQVSSGDVGASELESINVVEVNERGQRVAMVRFDPDDLDAAYAELDRRYTDQSLAPQPHPIHPNAATRARDRVEEAAVAADWAGLRALASDDFQFLDRGKQALVETGVDAWIEGLRFRREQGSLHRRELVATAGDRTDVERIVFARGPAAGAFEIEQLVVAEVTGDGQLLAVVRFDSDDRRAAFDEAAERFVVGEAAGIASQAVIAAFDRALASSDAAAIRAFLADDFVLDDRRGPGVLGTLEAEEWLESVRSLHELAPDWGLEVPRILAWNERGRVHLIRIFGTREGGPFENLFVRIVLSDGERVRRIESFDLEDTERALARFAELC